MASAHVQTFFPATDYDLAATLTCGQAFRWEQRASGWEGVVGGHWVRLEAQPAGIQAQTAEPVSDWNWLRAYLQLDADLPAILDSFPRDAAMQAGIAACRGLRLLRQEPWECLASFILSSTKQIVQIRQLVAVLCQRYGNPLPVPPGHVPAWSFPAPEVLAARSEAELRCCKTGFRAPNLLATARLVAQGGISLATLGSRTAEAAREELMRCPGVGPKIANCVLLFAFGFPGVFPVDVWVMKALRELYFPRRRPAPAALRRFTETYFGPNAGYAQQYLFHYIRQRTREGTQPG